MRIRYLFGKSNLNKEEKKYLDGKIEKLKKIFKDFEDDEIKSDIKVKQDKRKFWKVELMIRTPHEIFRAERRDEDFMTAMDAACRILRQRVRAK